MKTLELPSSNPTRSKGQCACGPTCRCGDACACTTTRKCAPACDCNN